MANPELHDCHNAPALLALVRDRRATSMRAEADLLAAAVAWAAMHATDRFADSITLRVPGHEGVMEVAGEGAPLVAEFSVHELATAMGLSSDAGRTLLGDAVELAHRLPLLYAQVRSLRLPVWKARRIAQSTKDLPFDGAAYVDQHLSCVAHKVALAQLDRTVEAARTRYDLAEAEARRIAAYEARHVTIETRQLSFDGHIDIHGTLDIADALDLEDAITKRAAQLGQDGQFGAGLPLDIRRSMALGDLARKQLALELNTLDDIAADPKRTKPRQVLIHVHVADAAIARLGNTRSLISVEQVKDWCRNGDTQVIIKPVIDLADHIHVDAYEVPDRLRLHQALVQHSCVFPWCRKPAARTDCDHVEPASRGGPTCDCNVAPLCRRHHRVKTHDRWRYDKTDPTTFVWRSPNGLVVRRDHHGTEILQP